MTLLSQVTKPESIDEIVGQSHLLEKNCLIRKMVESNTLFSIIFFGLPGIGKTSMAIAICKQLKIDYFIFNPTVNKKQDLEVILKNKFVKGNRLVIIIDEIHRMNRDKQDILLSYLEEGKIIIFGTTTENPYFTINPAIRSRCQIVELKPLSNDEMFLSLKKIIKKNKFKISDNQIKLIVNNSLGDLRSAINLLDLTTKIYKNMEIDDEKFKKLLPNTSVMGSSYGNEFYNLQSAFHKSLRGSDVDAAIYYLARLIKIGDIQSIGRRMIAMAYEDIGLANPNLLSRVILAINSAERLGFPEANQILSTTVIELCMSPKSNSSYKAISKALIDIDENGTGAFDIPKHLKDTHYKSASKLGYGGYKFPHDYKNNWIEQDYLPNELKGKKYYEKSNNEIELKMNKIWMDRKK